jgi:hypothetical protein
VAAVPDVPITPPVNNGLTGSSPLGSITPPAIAPIDTPPPPPPVTFTPPVATPVDPIANDTADTSSLNSGSIGTGTDSSLGAIGGDLGGGGLGGGDFGGGDGGGD